MTTTTRSPSLRIVRALGWAFIVVTVLLAVGVITKAEWLTVVLALIRGLLGLPA